MIELKASAQKKPDYAEIERLFSSFGWLSERSKPVQQRLLSLGRMREFQAGDTVYRFGDVPDGLHGMIRGQVCISVPNDAGSVFDCLIGSPGFWIGDLALLAKCQRLVTLTARTDVVTWFLPQQPLLDLLRPHPDLIADFYALNHRNMAIALRLLANMAIPDSTRRLSAWLLFSDESAQPPDRWIECAQEQIGLMNGLSLPTVRRALKRLESLDLIELGYRRVRVRDRSGLSDFCTT